MTNRTIEDLFVFDNDLLGRIPNRAEAASVYYADNTKESVAAATAAAMMDMGSLVGSPRIAIPNGHSFRIVCYMQMINEEEANIIKEHNICGG